MARNRLCALQFVSVAVCLWIQTQSVMADYFLEIRVTSYSNPTNQCADDSCSTNMGYTCCDSFRTTGCNGGDRCDNQFYYCLRATNTSPTTKGCIGYKHTVRSSVNQENTPIDFSQSTVLRLPNPMNLTGLDTFWRGVQLYIEVIDYDRDSVDEFVDSFSININENTTKGSNLTLPDKSENYTGELCERFDYCSAYQINCSEHGVCSNGENGYTCDCEPGYTGTDCETDIDYCGVNCSGHGQCVDGVNNFTCICQSGYTGDNCTVDVQGGAGGISGGIIGGVVGGLVAVILTVLLLVLLVVLVIVAVRKRQVQVTTQARIQTPDSPYYAVPKIEIMKQPTGTDVSDTVSYTVEFDNPIYGDDIEGPEYATPNTTRQPTTYETIPPLYETITDDVQTRPQTGNHKDQRGYQTIT